jgi:hypothetical protein
MCVPSQLSLPVRPGPDSKYVDQDDHTLSVFAEPNIGFTSRPFVDDYSGLQSFKVSSAETNCPQFWTVSSHSRT